MHTRIGPEVEAKVRKAWPDLLAAVASGANIGKACEAHGLKREHAYVYQLHNADARREWELARELSADAYADDVAEIANDPGPDPTGARVRMDALRWLAAKRNPRAYSDKQAIDLNVKTVDLTRIIQDANARLQAARQIGRIVEGAVITQTLPQAIEDLI